MRGPGPGYGAWAAALDRAGAPGRGTLVTGDRLAVDDIRFDVLWPDRGTVPREPPDSGRGINDVSIVLLGEVDGRRVLLTGDVEDDVDPVLSARGLPRIDFLKVAHHGSGTASTPAFLGVVRPALAVVSAGADNPYGHPARKTLDHLREAGATVFRTDTDGSVEVAFAAGRMTVKALGGRPVAARPPVTTSGSSRPGHESRLGHSAARYHRPDDPISSQPGRRMTPSAAPAGAPASPIAYYWGDDDLASSRALAALPTRSLRGTAAPSSGSSSAATATRPPRRSASFTSAWRPSRCSAVDARRRVERRSWPAKSMSSCKAAQLKPTATVNMHVPSRRP